MYGYNERYAIIQTVLIVWSLRKDTQFFRIEQFYKNNTYFWLSIKTNCYEKESEKISWGHAASDRHRLWEEQL